MSFNGPTEAGEMYNLVSFGNRSWPNKRNYLTHLVSLQSERQAARRLKAVGRMRGSKRAGEIGYSKSMGRLKNKEGNLELNLEREGSSEGTEDLCVIHGGASEQAGRLVPHMLVS